MSLASSRHIPRGYIPFPHATSAPCRCDEPGDPRNQHYLPRPRYHLQPFHETERRELDSTCRWLKRILEDAPDFYENWKWPKEVAPGEQERRKNISGEQERRKIIPDEEVGQKAPCKEGNPNVAKGKQRLARRKRLSPQEARTTAK